jgi:hypothetical protein
MMRRASASLAAADDVDAVAVISFERRIVFDPRIQSRCDLGVRKSLSFVIAILILDAARC